MCFGAPFFFGGGGGIKPYKSLDKNQSKTLLNNNKILNLKCNLGPVFLNAFSSLPSSEPVVIKDYYAKTVAWL
jgi:hypothetical protein